MIRSIYHIGTVPCHKFLHRYCTRSTYAHIYSLRSLVRKRTAFYAYPELEGQQWTNMTALRPSYRSRVQLLRHCNYKASGPLHVQPNVIMHACMLANNSSGRPSGQETPRTPGFSASIAQLTELHEPANF